MGKRKETDAHEYAEAHGWMFKWEPDFDADHSWCEDPEPHEHEVWGVTLLDRRGEHLASLWGIFDPDRAYGREIERELVTEARATIQHELLEAI